MQAKRGYRVSRKNLKKGDLLFFYTPGRYRSNRIVGHVGIYIGNDRMINTWGRPGVTITRLTSYWDRRFLFAKRVVQ
jgi:cell wall-associated NlpC family hydrolase